MEIDIAGIDVMIAMPVNRDIPPGTVMSLVDTVNEIRTRGIRHDFVMNYGGSLVHHSRSILVHEFMKRKCNRLFRVDSDISWKYQDFMKLLALSTQMEVVCGAYPIKRDPPVFQLGILDQVVEANEFGCIPVKGIGLGFTVIQRTVIEKLYDAAPKLKYPDYDEPIPRTFRCDHEAYELGHDMRLQGYEGEARGEDMAFFADIRELGYSVWVDPTIELGHIGQKTFSGTIGKFLDKIQPAAAA